MFPVEKSLQDYLVDVSKVDPLEDAKRRALLIPKLLSLAQALHLPRHAAHHAALLLHRSLLVLAAWSDADLIATSLLIAGKAEESPRKASDIISCMAGLSMDAPTRDKVLELESTAMARTGFDFTIDTPSRHLFRLSQANVADGSDGGEVAQLGLQILEQALATCAPLLFPVRVLAAACVVRAASLVEAKLKEGADWRCDMDHVAQCSEYIKTHKP